ncbi:MAG: hypothetical protein O6848_11665 [Bacteroidetes bacterium]|nr:hypothetical protein [Bacteroidota bacterium]
MSLGLISEDYVKLALYVGLYDSDFIDAYYGPEEWKPSAQVDTSATFPHEELKWETIDLIASLEELNIEDYDSMQMLRYKYLHKQLIAINTKLNMLAGELLPFDVESRSLYDAVTPHYDEEHYNKLLTELDQLLPGKGPLAARYEVYSANFIIPSDKLDTVFKAAIKEARARSIPHLDLPENESFTIEYVTDKAWSGYNWYKGNGFSVIQLNTDFPIYIERAIDLACHEGYPGHHAYNAMLEKKLVNEKGWYEFSVYPLFSPQSLIAEGSANYGIEVAFPGNERRKFEKDVIFPLAGLNPEEVDRYYDIQDVRSKLDYAGNEAAKMYLNGSISREKAAEWLVKYNLYSWDRALQRTRFFDKYRSYVINYNYGKDLVRNYVEANGGTDSNPEVRWEIFSRILSTPLTASILD